MNRYKQVRIWTVASWVVALCLSFIAVLSANAQVQDTFIEEEEELFELTPFSVTAEEDTGFRATATLAGTRLRTELRDIGSSISVLTEEFLEDIGGTDNQSVLAYATNFEVGGLQGNFQNVPNRGSLGLRDESVNHFNPNANTRVRGLTSADNTFNYFRTNVDWDSYIVGRIDLLRGPNAILFGLGSPGGVINATSDTPGLQRSFGEAKLTLDDEGSIRAETNVNVVAIKDELAVRVALLRDNKEFQQKPAFDNEDRAFVSVKYQPRALNREGMTFEILADYQTGDSTSNRPRTAPPLDNITAFMRPVITQAIQLPAGSNFNGYENGIIPQDSFFLFRQGVGYEDNVFNDFDQAAFGNADGDTRFTFNGAGGDTGIWRQASPVSVFGALRSDGSINTRSDRNNVIFGLSNEFGELVANSYANYLNRSGHPFAAAFNNLQISDDSVFDFYNNLLEGDNKREFSDFDQLRLVVSNTFFDQKLGYEISYFSEDSSKGQDSTFGGLPRIYIDANIEDIEGNPNPDYGRPYVQENSFGGNRLLQTELEGFRASLYFDHDFAEDDDSLWRRILGRHVVNGAYSEDTLNSDDRRLNGMMFGLDFASQFTPDRDTFRGARPTNRVYIGESLIGRDGIAGANLSSVGGRIGSQGGTVTMRYFDTTWTADPSVDPGATWFDEDGNPIGGSFGTTRTESQNPANYAGWTEGEFSVVDAFSGDIDDQNFATREATLFESVVKSEIFSWQGYLFDDFLVATLGWRRDRNESMSLRAPLRTETQDNSANVDPDVYNFLNEDTVESQFTGDSRSLSVVAHLNQIPVLRDVLPVNVSLSYSEGENFNPTSERRDINGDFIPPPQGETEELSILLSTKDNRYSMKLTRYETRVTNATSVQIPLSNFRLAHFLASNTGGIINAIEDGSFTDRYNNYTGVEPLEFDLDDQINIHAPAWRQFERDLVAAFPGMVDAYLTQGTFPPLARNTRFSFGFTNTEDNTSNGYEFELTAQPLDNLRVAFNASRTTATRENVPGPTTQAFYEFIQNALINPDGSYTDVGNLRENWSWNVSTVADFWLANQWGQYQTVRDLIGQPTPEVVEWRANAVASYEFTEGRLDGFTIGGAWRYEGESTIGFGYEFDELGFPRVDLDKEFKRAANNRFDLWIAYEREIWDGNLDWKIQLNIQNFLGDNKLIPISANPDGTVANWRIEEGQSFRLASTISF